jgi:hypothetical protein
MTHYILGLLAFCLMAEQSWARQDDATDSTDKKKPIAVAVTSNQDGQKASWKVDSDSLLAQVETEIQAQPVVHSVNPGPTGKASTPAVSLEEYIMVPVEDLEAQLTEQGQRIGPVTGKLKGKLTPNYAKSGYGAAATLNSASYGEGSGGGAGDGDSGDGDSADGDPFGDDGEGDIEEDDSGDDRGQDVVTEEVNL